MLCVYICSLFIIKNIYYIHYIAYFINIIFYVNTLYRPMCKTAQSAHKRQYFPPGRAAVPPRRRIAPARRAARHAAPEVRRRRRGGATAGGGPPLGGRCGRRLAGGCHRPPLVARPAVRVPPHPLLARGEAGEPPRDVCLLRAVPTATLRASIFLKNFCYLFNFF